MMTMNTLANNTSTAASVAPEDLRRGNFVAVLNEVVEFPSFFWCDSVPTDRGELVRARYLPAGGGMPLKVKAICLPFVFVKPPSGPSQTIDVRKVQLVRLEKCYAKTVWKKLRKQQSRVDRHTLRK
jgi:hypothetical protein